MEEVSNVVKTYYEVIEKKDEDIFELYRDNKRLQKQLDEMLTSEEDREAERRILRLLVETMKTELREKQVLIEEQENERSVLQSALIRAREVLSMNSELDHTANDVVDSLIAHYMLCYELQKQVQVLLQVCVDNSSATQFMLMANEERERQVIEEVCGSAYLTMAELCRHLVDAIRQQEMLRDEYVVAEYERRHEEELERKRRLVKHRQQERLLETWREKAALASTNVGLYEKLLRHEREEKELLMEGATERLDLMAEQGTDLLRILAFSLRSFLRCNQRLEEAHRMVDDAQRKNEKLQSSLAQVRARVRLLQRPDRSDGASGTLDRDSLKERTHESSLHQPSPQTTYQQGECTDLQVLQVELTTLKSEWQKCVERERTLRQQLSLVTNRHKVEKADLEAKVTVAQRRCAVLTMEVKRVKKDAKQHGVEVRQLQLQLQKARADLEQSVERCRTLEDKNAALEGQVASQLEAFASQERQLQDEMQAKEAQWDEGRRAYQEHIASLQKQVREDKDGFLMELKEWTLVLDDARKKIAAAEREREEERALRCMMDEQHRDETHLIRSVMDEKMMATSVLQKRVNQLEMACRRSADVITKLREMVHRNETSHTERTAR